MCKYIFIKMISNFQVKMYNHEREINRKGQWGHAWWRIAVIGMLLGTRKLVIIPLNRWHQIKWCEGVGRCFYVALFDGILHYFLMPFFGPHEGNTPCKKATVTKWEVLAFRVKGIAFACLSVNPTPRTPGLWLFTH